MNAKINALIKQSYVTVRTPSGEETTYFSQEKFAELIVKECSKVSNQYVGWRIGDIDLDMVYKEHFGVK